MIKAFIKILLSLVIVTLLTVTLFNLPAKLILSKLFHYNDMVYSDISGSLMNGSISGIKVNDNTRIDIDFKFHEINLASGSITYLLDSKSENLEFSSLLKIHHNKEIKVITNKLFLDTNFFTSTKYIDGYITSSNTEFNMYEGKCIDAKGNFNLKANIFLYPEMQQFSLPLECNDDNQLGTRFIGEIEDIEYNFSLFLYNPNNIKIDISIDNINIYDQLLLQGLGFRLRKDALIYSTILSIK